MKITKTVALALTIFGTSMLIAGAQDDGGGPPPDGSPDGQGFGGHHHHPPFPLVEALDVNHDGIIDSNEIANASAELLTLDKNGDGKLTPDEYLPAPPPNAPKGFRPPPSPLIEALDVNHDGVIDANEIANAPAELKTLDKNGDGQLTRDEYCPPPPEGMDGPPPGSGDSNDGPPPGPPPSQ
jgi:hypothetical protein